jgi:hypothetical protein
MDLLQLKRPQNIRAGLHAAALRHSPEYFQRELYPDREVSTVPLDWAEALEDEREIGETIELFHQQMTRQDLYNRVALILANARSACWIRVPPAEIVQDVAYVLHEAGEQAA